MQQADTAGSTRNTKASPGNRGEHSTLNLKLDLTIGVPLIARQLTLDTAGRMSEIDGRIENLKAFLSLVIGSDDLDDTATMAMGHIWQSLDDMRVLTSSMASAEQTA
ncbi:hypothetical protein [Sphingomonas hankookensis]|uniref:hypothetical protein n=1 Tax=Sphingomonas hankookensis TaxID=563996 RepID=UPI00234E7C78|nr:hypothetical protein [Sphingomonas hankookensis]WCP71549.1 hypothetical protein PPZ50_14490 [Sphingomonas hankookensis]